MNVVTRTQLLGGLTIVTGCSLFASADLAGSQKAADHLISAAKKTLNAAWAFGTAFAVSANGFSLLVGRDFFAASNYAVWYTRNTKNDLPVRNEKDIPASPEKPLHLER